MTINSFNGEYRWLSNFWFVGVCLEDKTYRSVEHAYVASKTLDTSLREEISKLPTPGMAKAFGRSLKLRGDWEEVRLEIMSDLVSQKFNRLDLKNKLLRTGSTVLIEGNTWGDTFWGVCNGVGENNLGKILMACRDNLNKEGSK